MGRERETRWMRPGQVHIILLCASPNDPGDVVVGQRSPKLFLLSLINFLLPFFQFYFLYFKNILKTIFWKLLFLIFLKFHRAFKLFMQFKILIVQFIKIIHIIKKNCSSHLRKKIMCLKYGHVG